METAVCAAAATKHKDARKTPPETFCLFALANSTESERIVIEKVIKRGGVRPPLQAPRASICFPRRALSRKFALAQVRNANYSLTRRRQLLLFAPQ
jgi:hypothetical protein